MILSLITYIFPSSTLLYDNDSHLHVKYKGRAPPCQDLFENHSHLTILGPYVPLRTSFKRKRVAKKEDIFSKLSTKDVF